ncbi:hypothetical protein HKX48_004114 [Thoreauomyces humboldtii]|nr:hypothetical protein HKX48_004114 [Thoreauomyces humboldtii]
MTREEPVSSGNAELVEPASVDPQSIESERGGKTEASVVFGEGEGGDVGEEELLALSTSPASALEATLQRRTRPLKGRSKSSSPADHGADDVTPLAEIKVGGELQGGLPHAETSTVDGDQRSVRKPFPVLVTPRGSEDHSTTLLLTPTSHAVGPLTSAVVSSPRHSFEASPSRSAFILTEEGVELGQSAMVDVPAVQSAQQLFEVSIPEGSSNTISVAKAVAVTLANGETFMVRSEETAPLSVTISALPPASNTAKSSPLSPVSPVLPAPPLSDRPRSPSPKPDLSKPLPPLPLTVPVALPLPAAAIPVRIASKQMPMLMQPAIVTRPTLFKKLHKEDVGADGAVHYPDTFSECSPRASMEAIINFEGVLESNPGSTVNGTAHPLRSSSVRSLFRKRTASPASPIASESVVSTNPETLSIAVPVTMGEVDMDSDVSASPPATISMAEMLSTPTPQQVADIVGPAMHALQERQENNLAPGVYSVINTDPETRPLDPGLSQAYVEAGFGPARASPLPSHVEAFSQTLVRNGPSEVIISPRISSLGTSRREEVSRKRFTYVGGDKLPLDFLNAVRPSDLYTSPEPREIATCPLCADICERAVRLSCCENICCAACIWRWLAHQTSCPFCRSDIAPGNVGPAPEVQGVIDRLHVKCKASGCDWEGPRSQLKQHIQSECRGRRTSSEDPRRITAPPSHPRGAAALAIRRPTNLARRSTEMSARPRMGAVRSRHHPLSQVFNGVDPPETASLGRTPRRIHIPARSPHPRIIFRRMSNYGGFVRPIHGAQSSPCIGIPPRTTSVAMGLLTAPAVVSPDELPEESEYHSKQLPLVLEDMYLDDPPPSIRRKRTTSTSAGGRRSGGGSSSSMSSPRRSSTYHRRSMTLARPPGTTSWDLIPGEDHFLHRPPRSRPTSARSYSSYYSRETRSWEVEEVESEDWADMEDHITALEAEAETPVEADDGGVATPPPPPADDDTASLAHGSEASERQPISLA